MAVKVVSVLGCGWMGLPVARQLVKSGYTVKGSTTTADKKQTLRNSKIIPYVFSFDSDCQGETADFFTADALFLNIPFRRDLKDPSFYKQQIESVIRFVETSPIRLVIFASSTSIYPENNNTISEDQPLDPADQRAQALWETENLLRYNKFFDTTILRFAGLYGEDRKIGNFLAGRRDIEQGDSPVNLVHLEDCVNIVCQIIEKDIRGETLNVCSDAHPARKELYTAAARKQGVPLPSFAKSSQKKFKIISNERLKNKLNYQFKFPDPLKSI